MTAAEPGALEPLCSALDRAFACGARPFEVIAGAPFARYGARVTFVHEAPAILARAFGLDDHPWGTPRWVGVRAAAGRGLRVKAYHAVPRLDARFDLPAAWPDDLYPVMGSLDGDAIEIYLRKRRACDFRSFAGRCLAPIGLTAPEPEPAPRPHDDAFGVSVRREHGRITAISVYSDWRALPRDSDIERIWSATLDESDRRAYQLAVAGVRSLGFLVSGNWHEVLAWTAEASGERHRAVSLAAPPVTMHDDTHSGHAVGH